MSKRIGMSADAEKGVIEKMEQQQAEQHKEIQQRLEERWEEA